MANDEHLARLAQGIEVWNEWRARNPGEKLDLRDAVVIGKSLRGVNLNRADLRQARLPRADLQQADLSGADLSGAYLREANLSGANLSGAHLFGADMGGASFVAANLRNAELQTALLTQAKLTGADVSDAKLNLTRLHGADLTRARLTGANLLKADFTEAVLNQTDFAGAYLYFTVFAYSYLAGAIGLEKVEHWGPSIIDPYTLSRSGELPISFLRGCGLPDGFIEYLPSLRTGAIQFYSCFISYSSRDQDFADRLYADLQNRGVRCWFAPDDLPIGAKTWDAIDEAIRLRDKLLLILSKSLIESEWVEDEVNKAYAEERSRKQVVLFPVRIDNAVMSTAEPWAVKLRDQRNIGDFRRWGEPAEYQRSLERLLRDLKTGGAE
jgi:uncharacterized protein YjbI with pentapeptide repeats